MTKEELKSLVKDYFLLVDAPTTETFGTLEDVNKAFTLKFPGDSIQVGDKVSVVTTEGQEMDAPNGVHEMSDGTKITTEESMVTEIVSADGEKAMSEEKMMDVEEVAEAVAEVITETKDEEVMEEVTTEENVSIEDVVKEIVDALQTEMAKLKTKMAEIEGKVAELENLPAAEPTVTTTEGTTGMSKFATEAPKSFNASSQEMMIKMIKSKKR